MAEGIARKTFGAKVDVESAGTHAHIRDPPAANAVKIIRDKFGIDISKHRSRNVSDVHIENFDYVVPMADDIHDYMMNTYPGLGDKLLPSWGIDDPYGGDRHIYEETADSIQKHVEEFSAFLKRK
jgi:protein-tyrosine-phosphatase